MPSTAKARPPRWCANAGGNGCSQLRANRPLVLAEVKRFLNDPTSLIERQTTTDADHVRIEVRRHTVGYDVARLLSDRLYLNEPALPGLATLAMVESEVEQAGRTHPGVSLLPLLRGPVRHRLPPPCVSTGALGAACIGCLT